MKLVILYLFQTHVFGISWPLTSTFKATFIWTHFNLVISIFINTTQAIPLKTTSAKSSYVWSTDKIKPLFTTTSQHQCTYLTILVIIPVRTKDLFTSFAVCHFCCVQIHPYPPGLLHCYWGNHEIPRSWCALRMFYSFLRGIIWGKISAKPAGGRTCIGQWDW